jgi:hypothetical protein
MLKERDMKGKIGDSGNKERFDVVQDDNFLMLIYSKMSKKIIYLYE